MENFDDQYDSNYYKLFNKKYKMVSSISNSVFVIHGIIILVALVFILLDW